MTEHDVPELASVAAGVVSDELVEAVVSDAAEGGVDLLGPDGVLAELTKRVLERTLAEEMADHLGYEHGDPIGHGTGNNRNRSTPKQVLTEIGAVDLDVPRGSQRQVQEIRSLGRTLTKWQTEILNHHRTGAFQRPHRRTEPVHQKDQTMRPRVPKLRQLPTPRTTPHRRHQLARNPTTTTPHQNPLSPLGHVEPLNQSAVAIR